MDNRKGLMSIAQSNQGVSDGWKHNYVQVNEFQMPSLEQILYSNTELIQNIYELTLLSWATASYEISSLHTICSELQSRGKCQ